jgi:hypothetical protein
MAAPSGAAGLPENRLEAIEDIWFFLFAGGRKLVLRRQIPNILPGLFLE